MSGLHRLPTSDGSKASCAINDANDRRGSTLRSVPIRLAYISRANRRNRARSSPQEHPIEKEARHELAVAKILVLECQRIGNQTAHDQSYQDRRTSFRVRLVTGKADQTGTYRTSDFGNVRYAAFLLVREAENVV